MGEVTVAPQASSEWKPSAADAKDIQGLVISAYPHLTSAIFLLLSFAPQDGGQPANAQGWLLNLSQRITDATGKSDNAVNLALSASGLFTIGFSAALGTFSRPFREGMTEPERARFLGDIDDQAPDTWEWRDKEVHALLMLYADSDKALQPLLASERRNLLTFNIRELGSLPQTVYPDSNGVRREHFGFADGFSQPNLVDGVAVPVAQRGLHDIPAGEVVLGQINTYGDPAPGPVVASSTMADRYLLPAQLEGFRDLGRNGTYLVIRQLEQSVAEFWKGMNGSATTLFDDKGKPATGEWLAQKVIGRTLDGDMLVPGGSHPRTNAAAPDNDVKFFAGDRDGFGCPVGSHVRRANPRDGLAPNKSDCQDLLQASNRHRIVRRGRTYGPRVTDRQTDDGEKRGLIFVCLNSEIDRQFELVQHTWLLNPMFGGMFNEMDPMLGPAGPFTVPSPPVRQKPSLARYVTVRGGGYFFLPSLSALRFLGGV